MPFTFSHPAFVLPLAKVRPHYFSYTGLFFGSIAPDCHMYFTFSIYPIIQNNIFGIFYLYLPLAILMSVVFHLLVRNILIMHLPSPFDKRYASILPFDFLAYLKKNYRVFLLSVFIAIAVHLALDNFTHEYTTFTKTYPNMLSSTIDITNLQSVKIYRFLQFLFSIFGLIFIVVSAFKFNKPLAVYVPISSNKKYFYYTVFAVLFSSILALRFTVPIDTYFLYDIILITLMSAAMVAVIFASAIVLVINKVAK